MNRSKVEEAQEKLDRSIKIIQQHFLANGKYIAGDEISIADLQAVCELTQLWMPKYEAYEKGSRVDQWMNDCKERLQPHFDEAHKMVYYAMKNELFKLKV